MFRVHHPKRIDPILLFCHGKDCKAVVVLTRYGNSGIDLSVIKSFADKETEAIWMGRWSRRLPADIQQRALRKLAMLSQATSLRDLRIPPSNRLEALRGDRVGQFAIRINEQWRICFWWEEGDASEVTITDYH